VLTSAATCAATSAVTALVHAYAERLDAGDLDGVAELFAGASWRSDRGTERRGTADVRLAYDPVILYDGSPRTRHVISNLIVEAKAAAATSRCYFSVMQAPPGQDLQIILAGRYHDRFELKSGQWRFAERYIGVDLVGDLRWHMRFER
jgi:3-phenylpropionate/cinnamic acid dioxygenase small subunit